jgi:hypothetical protein
LHVTWAPGGAASATGVLHVGVEEGGVGSGAKTPMNAVTIPTTKKAPPVTTYARSETHANTFPESMVPRHDEKANATIMGPTMRRIIPIRKISERI